LNVPLLQFAFLYDPPVGSGVIETCQKAYQLWQEEFAGMYHYGSAFILTMHPEIIGRPARVMMLERLIDYRAPRKIAKVNF
jgi:peptidoglycan-N-acetylglucosamine deacetylase